MSFSAFIRDNLDAIVKEWEEFARTLLPSAGGVTDLALQDHACAMLIAIATDMEAGQSTVERTARSKHFGQQEGAPESAAAAHGRLRQMEGLDVTQLIGEFRALRASTLALWRRAGQAFEASAAIEEIARFNEGIDQAIAESVDRYTKNIATFMAVIGRDLRSPLWAIKASSEILSRREVSDAVRHEVMLRISRSSESMGLAISDLLTFSETHLGQAVPIRKEPCDVEKICRHALDAVKSIYPAQEFALTLTGDLVVTADPVRIEQVVMNLLNNAVHHSDKRSPISIEADGQAHDVFIIVRNQGRPIAEDALNSIFEPTLKLPSTGPQHVPYAALGLSLFVVREILTRHHGSISVESQTRTGTAFTVKLPRTAEESKPSMQGPRQV